MKPIACPPTILIDKQQGSVLLEALIAILIFSFGLLGLIGIQASAVGLSIDAKYRADAAYLANQIVSQMWVDRANLDGYAHHAGGNACAPTGGASGNTKVHNGANSGSWTYQVAQSLPGATEDKQQIKVTTVGTTRRVEVALCWKRPQETTWHSHLTTTQINQ
jgi:type IV pilus assembly protein PilV